MKFIGLPTYLPPILEKLALVLTANTRIQITAEGGLLPRRLSGMVSLHLAEKHFPENHLPEKHFPERFFFQN